MKRKECVPLKNEKKSRSALELCSNSTLRRMFPSSRGKRLRRFLPSREDRSAGGTALRYAGALRTYFAPLWGKLALHCHAWWLVVDEGFSPSKYSFKLLHAASYCCLVLLSLFIYTYELTFFWCPLWLVCRGRLAWTYVLLVLRSQSQISALPLLSVVL